MRRVLFVDDEPRFLEGLQRILRPQKHMWEMAFAPNGYAALAIMEASPFDVIVSDMRMPGLDGAALLARVREEYPQVVRIVLSNNHGAFHSLAHSTRRTPIPGEALRCGNAAGRHRARLPP